MTVTPSAVLLFIHPAQRGVQTDSRGAEGAKDRFQVRCVETTRPVPYSMGHNITITTFVSAACHCKTRCSLYSYN